jgi:CSLREA domain-containing protein
MSWLRGILLIALAVGVCVPSVASAATIKVTTRADEMDVPPDAKCSLREAVAAANSNDPVGGCPKGSGPDDTVVLGKGNYRLVIPTTDEDQNANGDLDVDGGKVTFVGKGGGVTVIKTSLADRVVDVHDSTPVVFKSIGISGGDVTSFGTGTGRGGNIAADSAANLTFIRAIISHGRAFVGGGLYLNSPSSVSRLKVSRSTFITNHATGLGGALDVIGDVKSTISKSTIYENTVQNDNSGANAGGISHRGIKMTISDSEFLGNAAMGDTNEAAGGGAIYNSGGDAELVIRRSLFEFNSASAPTVGFFEGGGAIFTATTTAPVSIVNSTFHSNTVGAPNGQGAGIYVNNGAVTVTNATFNANGDESTLQTPAGSLLVRNSILEGPNPCAGLAVDSGGYNVASVDDSECGFLDSDVTDAGSFGFKTADPKENGGATRTLALKGSSRAVDLIPKAACGVARGEDQRGFDRPKRKCDSGAYERGAKP